MSDIMPSRFKTAADLHLDALSSSYDPILLGVACGLAELFPPIHNPQRTENEAYVEMRYETCDEAA
jgi:hypothetical protein